MTGTWSISCRLEDRIDGTKAPSRSLPQGEFEARIDSMSHDGRGVARVDGKATFVHGACPVRP